MFSNPVLPGSHLAAIASDDAPFLLEWAVYHRLIGFERITVYGDDITPQASQLGRAMAEVGLINFIEGVALADSGRGAAMIQCFADLHKRTKEDGTEWLLPFAIEEFLLISTGDGTLPALMQVMPRAADLISATWQIFGNGGHGSFGDGLITRRFTRAGSIQPGHVVPPLGVKTMFRPHIADSISRHRPVLAKDDAKWINGDRQNVTAWYRETRWSAPPERPGYGEVRVAYFATRDNASWLLRSMNPAQRQRGLTPADFRALLALHQRINVNRTQETALLSWADRIQPVIAQLLHDHPALDRSQTAAVNDMSQRIDDFTAGLDGNARRAIELFQQDKPVPPDLLDWEITGRISRRGDASQKWQKLVRTRKAEVGEEDLFVDQDERPEFDADDPDLVIRAPAWLSDLRLSANAQGFYRSIPGYALTHVHRSDEHLIVSFDNLSSVRDNPVDRNPWGYEFVRKSGWSHLGVMGYGGDWYRNGAIFDELTRLRDEGIFERYAQVTLMGTSMGAFAACAFAPLAPGCKVIAFSPQETLDQKLVPWETRFGSGRRANWSGRFASANEGAAAASQAWLFYDPCFAPDLRHAQRFSGKNIVPVQMRLSGHKTALILRAGGVLSSVVRGIVTGDFSANDFSALYQPCRRTPAYLSEVATMLSEKGRQQLLHRYIQSLEKADMKQLAKTLRRKYPA